MRYLIYYPLVALRAVIGVAIGYALARRFGVGVGLPIGLALAVVATAVGALALRTSEIGRITWKNRVAGWLMPWGFRIARGTLGGAAIACAVVWLLLGALGAVLYYGSLRNADGTAWGAIVPFLLLAAWLVDGAGLLYLLGNFSQNISYAGMGHRMIQTFLKGIGLIVVLFGASVPLYLTGHPNYALLIAAGPPLALASVFGLMILPFALSKNKNWH